MKRKIMYLVAVSLTILTVVSCDKVKDPEVISVTLGAQGNTTVDGFYAVEENETYTMATAADNQGDIDIFCFYEAETGNNIALAAPGTGITGIFTGVDAPETWTSTNTTFFIVTTITEEQFEAVQEGDALIVSSFDSENARRKAKDIQTGQVWSFMTQDAVYGLLLVADVVQGAEGKATFVLKTKKVIDAR